MRLSGGAVLLTLAAAVCSGCSGNTGTTGTVDPPAAVAEQPALFGDMPAPSSISHAASIRESPTRCYGKSYRSDLMQQHVAVDGTGAVFTPTGAGASASGVEMVNAAIAFYSIDVSVYADESAPLRLDLDCDDLGDPSALQVYAGISDLYSNRWKWHDLSYTADVPTAAQFSSLIDCAVKGTWLDVVVVVFGDTPLSVSSVSISPDIQPMGGELAFHKGWDGTTWGRDWFARSFDIEQDATGRLHVAYYDSSNGQLYHMWEDGRIWKTQAVDADGDVGSSCDLVATPDGGLALAYYDADQQVGAIRWMAPEDLTDMVWSPRSNFESGLDDGGLTIDAGAHPSVAFDAEGVCHIAYEDTTNRAIRHAWRPLGGIEWLHENITAPDTIGTSPRLAFAPAGMCCTYIANPHSVPGMDGSLILAVRGADAWSSEVLADDVIDALDTDDDCDGYLDMATVGNDLTVAYSSRGGGKVCVQDIHFTTSVRKREGQFSTSPTSGAFIDLTLLADGSVRIAHYDPSTFTVYFETGDVPTPDQFSFTSLPAVQLDGPDEDCDGIAFWLDPDEDGDSGHDSVLVTLTSKLVPATGVGKKEFKGHVTLLK